MNQEEFARKLHAPPPELAQLVEDCMSDQEFLIHINALIPFTSEEANSNLLDFANSFWIELKEDLYHTFSFVAHHFTPEVLQGVYDLSGDANGGMLPWGLIGAAIYLQTNTPVQEIQEDAWDHFTVFSTPETPNTLSALAICTVRENGRATRFYTRHFGQFDPLKLLYGATALAIRGGSTITKAIQQIDCHMRASGLGSARAVSGPESKMTDKLFQLMGSSPITAAHITIDVDSGNVVTKMNPLWEKLRDELKPDPPAQQQKHDGKEHSSRRNHQLER